MCFKWQPHGNHTIFSVWVSEMLIHKYFNFFFASCIFLGIWWKYLNLLLRKLQICVNTYTDTHNFAYNFQEIMALLKATLDPHVVNLCFTWGRSGDLETLVSPFMQLYHFFCNCTIFNRTSLTYFLNFISDLFYANTE